MTSSFVLLNREVVFNFRGVATGGGVPESIHCSWESPEEVSVAVTKYLENLKVRAVIAYPPDFSFLRIVVPVEYEMLPPPLLDMQSGRISSADKNLVALYAGYCRPGTGVMGIGGYLIYDASKDTSSAVPMLLDDHFHAAIGCESAVVMRNGDDGGYFLAELVWVRPAFSEAAIWLWKSSAPGWSLKPARVHLPPGFCANLCFSYRGSILCWVDLLLGMVMCDLDKGCSNSDAPELRFILLPKDLRYYDPSEHWNRYNLCPESFRSMACVGDTIKFVSMDGSVQHVPGKEFELTVHTLLPDLSDWEISSKYNVENIWANESYHSTGMPKIAPSFPVLSIHEDGVIYLVFTDFRLVDANILYTSTTVGHKCQYLVRLDIQNKKVHFYPLITNRTIGYDLLGSDFSAYQKCLQDHPREGEAIEMVASGKRLKL